MLYGESWRGAIPYSVAGALRDLGHSVSVFDQTPFLLRQRLRVRGAHYLDKLLFRAVARIINRKLLERIREERPEYVWIFKGLHVRSEAVREARRSGAVVLNYNWDDFSNPIHDSPHLQAAFAEYDLILTPRPHHADRYQADGARRVEYVNVGFDPTIHYPISVPPHEKAFWGAPVSFVGSWSPRRQKIIAELAEFGVKVWGGSWWRARPALARRGKVRVTGRTAMCEEMSRVLNASEINLNILTAENNDRTNLRNFEIAACGAFQLAERSPEVLELFDEDKEIVCYASEEELRDKCRYYLRHAEERARIARAGYERVIRDGHTYLDRTKEILEILEQL